MCRLKTSDPVAVFKCKQYCNAESYCLLFFSDIRCKNINLKIPNGKADIFPFNQFGAVAKYSCADSYQLVGIPLRVCQGDETWSGEEPKCIINGSIGEIIPIFDTIFPFPFFICIAINVVILVSL